MEPVNISPERSLAKSFKNAVNTVKVFISAAKESLDNSRRKLVKALPTLIAATSAALLLASGGEPVQAGGGGPWVTNTPTRTNTPRPSNTPTPRPTSTPLPTATRVPATETPAPTATRVPATETPRPTATRVPATETPVPTATRVLATETPRPTVIPVATIVATIDSTPIVIATNTKLPPTVTPVSTIEFRPTPTKKKPTATPTKKKPTATPIRKPVATATKRPTPRPTATPRIEIFPTPKVIMLPHTGEDQRFLDEQNSISSRERFVTEVDNSSDNWVVEEYSEEEEVLDSIEFLPEETVKTDPRDAIALFTAAVALAGTGALAASRKRRR